MGKNLGFGFFDLLKLNVGVGFKSKRVPPLHGFWL
jgi:hypothetical protein